MQDFDPVLLSERSKLLLKLVSVTVLTVNAGLLHHFAFPVLMSDEQLNWRKSMLLAVTGSLSTLHWLLAAFVGVSKPLGRLPLDFLLGSYVLLCVTVVMFSVACLGLVRQHVLDWRSRSNPETYH